jgi:hypothetical protein
MAELTQVRCNVPMARYRCPRCHEITHRPELFAFCGICSAPLSAANLEPEEAEDRFEAAPPLSLRSSERHALG